MGGTPISLRQKLRMQRERMQCAGLWPVVLNVLNSYINEKKVIIAPVDSQATCVYIYKTRLVKTNNKFQDRRARCEK